MSSQKGKERVAAAARGSRRREGVLLFLSRRYDSFHFLFFFPCHSSVVVFFFLFYVSIGRGGERAREFPGGKRASCILDNAARAHTLTSLCIWFMRRSATRHLTSPGYAGPLH